MSICECVCVHASNLSTLSSINFLMNGLSHHSTFSSIYFHINWLAHQLTFSSLNFLTDRVYSSLAQLIVTFKTFSLVFKGVGVHLWPIYFENFDNFLFFAHNVIYVIGTKINFWGFTSLWAGGVRTKVIKLHNFFLILNESFPDSVFRILIQ